MFVLLTHYLTNRSTLNMRRTITTRCVIKTELSHFVHLSLFQISTNKHTHMYVHTSMLNVLWMDSWEMEEAPGCLRWLSFISFSSLCRLTRWPSLWKHLGHYCCWMAPLFLHSSVVWTLLWFPWLIITKATSAFLAGYTNACRACNLCLCVCECTFV